MARACWASTTTRANATYPCPISCRRAEIDTVAIVGGGFSGTLAAINLVRHAGPRAVLIERRAAPARGLAFGAAHPAHLLNVRAGNMSAYPDDPAHFARWLEARGAGDGTSFAPRRLYGDYLAGELAAARVASDRLRVMTADAVDVVDDGAGIAVRTVEGDAIGCDAVILALGNLPPHVPPGLDPAALGHDRYCGDPWSPALGEGLGDNDTVLLLGTGLTMVDAALLLDADGFRGRIVALSRRGLLPRRHAETGPVPGLAERPVLRPASLVGHVRRQARAVGWRAAVDQLRPYTQGLWLAATADERARFLRHLRPWLDVHRHRIAPTVADRVEALQATGRLVVLAGKPERYLPHGTGVEMHYRPRGCDRTETIAVRRIVNCTGPAGDLLAAREPILERLAARGLIRPDPYRLGLDVDAQARAVGRDGTVDERIYALGPMTRGAFWEINAVPDIRHQAWTVARRLSHAQWVGGEGL